MGDSIYFKFQPVEGSVPKYEYHGGTQAGWAIGSLSISERTGCPKNVPLIKGSFLGNLVE